jgi:hypothetical protein
MSDLEVTIQGRRFEHMAYHFVLTYSNWESCTVCFSESFESLSEGMQNALWKLGAVPQAHRTDRLTAAVNNLKLASAPQSPTGDGVKEEPQSAFKRRYEALLSHYGLKAERTQPRRANENGDIEQRHHRLKQALDQALMLRGSRDFTDRSTYERFVQTVENQLNAGRQSRLAQEMAVMRSLPARRLESYRKLTDLRVNSGSLIRVDHNVYSVNSRLIGEKVNVRLYVEHVEVWHGQRLIEQSPRLRGRSKSRINYRHVIDWLVRKIPRYTTNCMNS